MICWVLAMEMLQGVWKQHLRPRAVVGYGVKIFIPSPPNYVTRSPGWPVTYCFCDLWMKNSLRSILILTGNDVVVMIFTQEAPPTRKWFSGRSCIRSNWNYKLRLGVNFEEGGNRECPEETLEVRLRSTETQSTYNICSRSGRRDWCPQRQPDFPAWCLWK